jgi:hypothetical protein
MVKALTKFLEVPTACNEFYSVNDIKFNRDIDALIYASQNPGNIMYHLDFEIFKKHNYNFWLTEPEKDIQFYFDKYAKIIKNSYDNIYLSYSGGTDSHTILNTFISNNIKDLTLINISETNPINTKLYHEIKKPINLLSNKYRNIFKNLRYKLVGYDDNYLDTYIDPSVWESIIRYSPGAWNTHFNQVNRSNVLLRYFNDANSNKLLTLKSKDCLVYGYEKPYITIKNDWWGWQTDNNMVVYLDGRVPYFNAVNNIYFFISNEVPEIQVKMAWLKIKAIHKILKSKNIKITAENVTKIQQDQQKHYIRINQAMGLQSLSSSLSTKIFAHEIYHIGVKSKIKIADPVVNNPLSKDISSINEKFYNTYIRNNIADKFLSPDNGTVSKIYSDFIPICRVIHN